MYDFAPEGHLILLPQPGKSETKKVDEISLLWILGFLIILFRIFRESDYFVSVYSNMQDIVQITSATPIRDIIRRFRWLFYSKHSDWIEYILDEELPFIEKAMKEFIGELGKIHSKSTKWEARFFIGHPPFIQFYDLGRKNWANYYDMNEIDRRYIDFKIAQWLEDA
uniref:Uncharacterized protein n=1 Tax=Candidatus Kentrum sp. LPFa TaxID=2126335 RepID=A0A450WH15_9GAMM|nr:MAG: hypothetical protein BECKLPF1236A_GA0070988_101427 [Candidatus Kentron sp. LPFa]VFK31639.1 MAG: hypothetical protein BECKLPF1236C_GA0070990_101448 [Candidatus Kentron sp. LPFa]